MNDNLNEHYKHWSKIASMRGMMTGKLKDESLESESEREERYWAVMRNLISEPIAKIDAIENEILNNIKKTNKELEERKRIRKLKEEK